MMLLLLPQKRQGAQSGLTTDCPNKQQVTGSPTKDPRQLGTSDVLTSSTNNQTAGFACKRKFKLLDISPVLAILH